MFVSVNWQNPNPNTIYNKLQAKLGRIPTNNEIKLELDRIMSEALCDLADKGKLRHQRK